MYTVWESNVQNNVEALFKPFQRQLKNGTSIKHSNMPLWCRSDSYAQAYSINTSQTTCLYFTPHRAIVKHQCPRAPLCSRQTQSSRHDLHCPLWKENAIAGVWRKPTTGLNLWPIKKMLDLWFQKPWCKPKLWPKCVVMKLLCKQGLDVGEASGGSARKQ